LGVENIPGKPQHSIQDGTFNKRVPDPSPSPKSSGGPHVKTLSKRQVFFLSSMLIIGVIALVMVETPSSSQDHTLRG
jgi:hypothetical protein